MAKKSLSVPPAATPAVPKLKNEKKPNLSSSQVYFFQWALKAWENCKANLPRFAAESGRYTEEFVDAQIALVKEVKALPSLKARNAVPRELLLSLKGARQSVSDMATRLANAINYSYKDAAVAATQRSGAGLVDFDKLSDSDWGGTSSFIETANTYLGDGLAALVASGAVNADFVTKFAAVGTAFDTIWSDLQSKLQKAEDSQRAVQVGIVEIKKELNPMLKDAASNFKYEPALLALFKQTDLLDEVRTGHIAGIKGSTKWPAEVDGMKPKPQAGILVEVLGVEGKSATTNNLGRYKIKIAGGTYQVRFSGPGMVPVVQLVNVIPGVDRIVNLLLSPAAPVGEDAPPMAKTATPPPSASMNDVLATAMKEVGTAPTNGVAAAQNGHLV